ncbi:hypothetical protein GCM10017562_59250 [Streptomyces roseofulvus]
MAGDVANRDLLQAPASSCSLIAIPGVSHRRREGPMDSKGLESVEAAATTAGG